MFVGMRSHDLESTGRVGRDRVIDIMRYDASFPVEADGRCCGKPRHLPMRGEKREEFDPAGAYSPRLTLPHACLHYRRLFC